MKILAAATTVGAAEALLPVIRKLSALRHTVKLIGVTRDTPEAKLHGGAADVFRREQIPFTELFDLGYVGSVVHVPAIFVRSILEVETPDRILVGCIRDPSGALSSFENALVEASQRTRIPVVQVIDGWDVWYPRKTGYSATALAVQDRLTKEVIVRRGGIAEGRIFVTGQPALDTVPREDRVSLRERARHELGLYDERVLLYCSQVSSPNPLTLKWTVRAMRASDCIIFHRHPRDQRHYSETLLNLGNRLIDRQLSTSMALAVADVCITHYSTVGLYAVILGIPAINILLDEEFRDVRDICGGYPLARMGLSKEVNSEEELARVLCDKLEPLDPQKVRESLHLDGRSADRVVELLAKLSIEPIAPATL